ncbi:unnamed protein product [Fraxinus pennsylvanica]|uniref:Uncharacterized protein n=1 Tax=Fraxinus pennsylvanica TaxID=56036 RepID=A0AAD2EA50_9LAMI|nr:unnamed protein product [Fraxinus pennsylvanica]
MLHNSLSITYPKLPLSSFPSNSTFDSPGTFRFSKCKIFSKQSFIDNGNSKSTDLFLQNNSFADFMRFKRGDHGQLQTAVVSYRKKFPWSLLQPFLQVDLVSTIHIADKEYFATLQKELELYDCVLYEMVASRESLESRTYPAAKKKLKGTYARGFNIIGCIQRQMARLLMLDFQLDCLEYQAENWYHADLDFETFKSLQLEKGESFFTFARDMTLRSTKAILKQSLIPEDLGPWRSKLLWASRVLPMPLLGLVIIGSLCADVGSQPAEYPELKALSKLDFGAAMKVFLAKRLTSEFIQVTADVEEGSVIIGERNKAAIKALDRAMSDGHNKIAILYGGGHMPDLGRRLREEFDLVPSRVQWITAWSITNKHMTILALDLWFWELFFGTTANWVSHVASDIYQYIDSAQNDVIHFI